MGPPGTRWLLVLAVAGTACGSTSTPQPGVGGSPSSASAPSPSTQAPSTPSAPGAGADGSAPGASTTTPSDAGTIPARPGAVAGDTCATLTVSPAQPVVVEFAWPSICDGAISSPSGDVALGTHSALNAPPVEGFALLTPDGTRLGSAAPTLGPWPIVDPWLHPTSSGFQGIAALSTGLQCAAWDRSGALRVLPCPGHAVTSAPTASGGTLFVVGPGAGGDALLVRADAQGNLSAGKAIGGAASLVLESWRTSHALTVDLSTGAARARWFDENGDALTRWFGVKARTPAYGASLKLLVDGTIALNDGTAWTALLRDGVEGAEDPPGWLGRLSHARLATIREGLGYAVLRDDAGGGATFEVITTDGTSCGTVTLPADRVQRLDVGYDGTLFAIETAASTNSAPGGCQYRWWPSLLR